MAHIAPPRTEATGGVSRQLRPAIVSLVFLTIITGVVYPLIVTGIAQLVLPAQANGSIIRNVEGQAVGSRLIGQQFDEPRYFWGRPSATTTVPYNAFNAAALTGSSGSNYGPLNEGLVGPDGIVQTRITALREADPGNTQPIPVDLVTASGSGLDPHISPASAEYQIGRVARERGFEPDAVRRLVAQHTQGRQFGILGEPRVNVLELNLALDAHDELQTAVGRAFARVEFIPSNPRAAAEGRTTE